MLSNLFSTSSSPRNSPRGSARPSCSTDNDDEPEAEQAEEVDWTRFKDFPRMHELMLRTAPNVHARDAVGRTALHFAAGYGYDEAALELLRRGAHVDAADRFGATPLHWACLKAHAPLVELLLAANADPQVAATAGVFKKRTPLDMLSAHDEGSEVRLALTKSLQAHLFEQRKVLGRGGFGTVIKAVRRDTGLTVALKEVRKPDAGGSSGPSDASAAGGLRGARVERDVLSTIDHPFVVQLHCAYQTRDHLYLALGYCSGGDIALHIRCHENGRLPEATSRFVCAELLLALEALHQHGVIHRDVKTENVLVDAHGHIRLADLNAAKRDQQLAKGGRTYSVVGTPFAAAPEVLLGQGYTTSADWWSFGVLLFECLSGRPPYPKDQSLIHAHARLVHEIVNGERAPLPDDSSDHAAALIDGLLERDEPSRLSDPLVLRAHPFFRGTTWSALLAKLVPSPLLPSEPTTTPSSRKGEKEEEEPQNLLDVFAYPSMLPNQPKQAPPQQLEPAAKWNSFLSMGDDGSLDVTDGAATSDGDAAAATSVGGAASAFNGWEYSTDEQGSQGVMLWRRVRARVDQLAKLQGLSRHAFLICVILTLAANRCDENGAAAPGGGSSSGDAGSVLAALESPSPLAAGHHRTPSFFVE